MHNLHDLFAICSGLVTAQTCQHGPPQCLRIVVQGYNFLVDQILHFFEYTRLLLCLVKEANFQNNTRIYEIWFQKLEIRFQNLKIWFTLPRFHISYWSFLFSLYFLIWKEKYLVKFSCLIIELHAWVKYAADTHIQLFYEKGCTPPSQMIRRKNHVSVE